MLQGAAILWRGIRAIRAPGPAKAAAQVTKSTVLALFIAAVIGGSLYRLILFLNMSVADSRDIDVHTSHIRYCLNAVFAIFILFYFTFSNGKLNTGQKALAIVAAVWLVLFMAYLNYTTGILIFAIVSFILLVFFTLKNSREVCSFIF